MKRYRLETEAIMSGNDGVEVTKGYVNAALPAVSMNRAYNKAIELSVAEFEGSGFTVRAFTKVSVSLVSWGD